MPALLGLQLFIGKFVLTRFLPYLYSKTNKMNRYWVLLFLFFFSEIILSQDRFVLPEQKNEVTVPFEFVNNLIILKVAVNKVPLNLLFDTGIQQTILINVKTPDSLNLKFLQKRNFTGVGKDKKIIKGLLSTNNRIDIGGKIFNKQAAIYIITGTEFHFSESIGVNINGFIGGELIKDYIVKIDYKRKQIHFYKHRNFNYKKLKRYHYFPLEIYHDKPYIKALVQIHKKAPPVDLKFLIDTGNSDAVWLFTSKKLKMPSYQKTVKDYFGLGFSGEIQGEKAKAHIFQLDKKYRFKKVYVSIPDSIYFAHFIQAHPFDGLIGNEVMRRFYVVFDYQNKALYLKRYRHNYHEPFSFNDTGIYLSYDGKIPVKVKFLETQFETNTKDNSYSIVTQSAYTYKYEMRDRIIIQYIRKNSPADRAGLAKGDILLEINGISVYQYRLDELEKRFFYHNQKKLDFLIKRKGLILHFKVDNTNQL